MAHYMEERLVDIFPPAIRRENIGLCMTEDFKTHSLPDKGNHRQSRTQEIGSSNYGD